MTDAVGNLITNLENTRTSLGNTPIRAQYDVLIAALEEIQGGLSPSGPEAANRVFAGPPVGSPSLPSFRTLVEADIDFAVSTGGLSNVALIAAAVITWAGRSKISSPANGTVVLTNNAGTDFTELALGGITAAFPALARNAAALQAQLADGSGLANFICSQLQPNSLQGILGTTTNDNANAGSVGQFIESVITAAAPVAVVSGTPKTLMSIVLTAGDWSVSGQGAISSTGAATTILFGPSMVTNTLPAAERYSQAQGVATGNGTASFSPQRFSLAAGATIFGVIDAGFVGAGNAYGYLNAWRMR